MNKTKEILIVTHQYTPHLSPRTTRWKSIVDELVSLGHEVKIVTGTQQNDLNQDKNIIYVGNKSSNNFVNNLRDKSNNLGDTSKIKKIYYRSLKGIYRFVVKTFSWPDYSMFWLLSIIKNKKKLNIDYDIMISVSLPFSSHIAGYIINKKKKKEWIMDIGDPFTLKKDAPENNKYLYWFLNKYYENKFYLLASKILFTHKESLDFHQEYFKIDTSKTFVANPISKFNHEIFNKSLNYDYSSKPIKFGYFGIFTKGVRSPRNFLESIKGIDDLEIFWYVNEDSREQIKSNNLMISNSHFKSIVPREEAIDLMADSVHCLISIGNMNTNQLPSKVIEYLSTGKPVIHFAEVRDDPVNMIAEKFDNLFVLTKEDNIEKFFFNLNNYFKNIDSFDKELFIENYTASSVIKILDLT